MSGADIVSGIRNDRKTDPFFKKITALMFYKIMNILGAKIPPNHSDYRLVSKRAIDVMELYPEKSLFCVDFLMNWDYRLLMSILMLNREWQENQNSIL